MTFVTAVKTSLRKWRDFSGRAPRKEFWSFVAFAVGTLLVAAAVRPALAAVLWVVLIIPYYAVVARRLHDTGRTGWTVLIAVIPFGRYFLVYLLAKSSQGGDNAYGLHPYRPGEVPYVPAPAGRRTSMRSATWCTK